ncbi:MAG: cytochrome c oxidase subunit 3 [Deltaproteobacteria bacterium]|nr:cytochrome c oxidase subunit 3 [Deltaproteobacteria bacterium]
MPEHARSAPAHQFETVIQQKVAASLGMWTFLATEILIFGGLFTAYLVFRVAQPETFATMSRHMDLVMGTLNTGVLLTSSLTMALAVRAAHASDRSRAAAAWLMVTAALGAGFLVIKGLEWHHEYGEHLVPLLGLDFDPHGAPYGEAHLFMSLYFLMTGLHAIHLALGCLLVLGLALLRLRRSDRASATVVEMSGLYWHLVDIVWVFLFPLLYLVGTRS